MSVRLTISGDFCITPAYLEKDLISPGIKQVFGQSDINIVNLECPVNDGGEDKRIIKNGPHLQTRSEITDYLRQLNIRVVTLANNHILDYGVEGLHSTVHALRNSNIAYTGVGANLKEAANPLILSRNGLKIAIVNCCENEWSVATIENPGANPLDLIDNLAQIRQVRQAADFVLVVIHGGSEHYSLPSPRMVKQYRFFAENGADAVISHHSHCISGFEVHNGVPIFYGLGNIIFTRPNEHSGWFTGLSLILNLEIGQPISWVLLPTGQSKETYRLDRLDGERQTLTLQEVERLSGIIADEKKFQAAWTAFIEERKSQYLLVFSGINILPGKYLRSAARRMGLMKRLLPKKHLLSIMNYIFCEAHLDVSKEVLNHKLFGK